MTKPIRQGGEGRRGEEEVYEVLNGTVLKLQGMSCSYRNRTDWYNHEMQRNEKYSFQYTHTRTYIHTYILRTYKRDITYIRTVRTIHKVSVSELGPSQEDVLWTDWELPVQEGRARWEQALW